MRYLSLVRSLALFALLFACSSTPSGAPPPYCASDPRVETFTLGMSAKGPTGASFAITSATPPVVQQGLNEWTIAVKDSAGNALDGALTVASIMPDHNHGSPTQATITPKGGGAYDVAGINLSMRGVWQVTFSITTPTVTDDATFTFCVDGAS